MIDPITETKVLKIEPGSDNLTTTQDKEVKIAFPQWTIEVMVNRSRYERNNRAIIWAHNSDREIYYRFGDVTINPNLLQLQAAGSQIDVPASMFAAKPDTWYMISLVFDGTTNFIYVNGELVAQEIIREGAYNFAGVGISGQNELMREVRVYNTARTAQQIKANVWKTADYTDPNLVIYYPLNGKKYNPETKEITEDDTKIWDWTKGGRHIDITNGAKFVNQDNGSSWVFPLPSN